MMRSEKRATRRRRGAGMTEYIIITGMIAILMVPLVGKTGLGGVLYETIVGTDKAITDGIVNGADRGGGVNGGGGGGNPGGNPGGRPPRDPNDPSTPADGTGVPGG